MPSERMTTPIFPAPAAADGVPEASVSGFQNDVQAPVQAGLPGASRFELYSAIPRESTSTLPTPSTRLTETVFLALLDADEFVDVLPPHAATASAATSAPTGMSSRFTW